MIQIYFCKKNFQVQKAERFFKERRVPVQLVDLGRARLGRRELEAVKARVGLDALVDREGAAWKECPARFAAGEEAVFNALLEDPRRLVLPIVRNGKEATVGYRPEEWERWL
ncbi:MAG TPA: ArsC family transcriptional regulator [Candidatus Aphodomonas merdavium]|nr:ArsC family transcriptional regulator [Candidatus Aphodomonas merdavium]